MTPGTCDLATYNTIAVEISEAVTRLTVAVATGERLRILQRRWIAPAEPATCVSEITQLVSQLRRDGTAATYLKSPIVVAVWGTLDATSTKIHRIPGANVWTDFPLARAIEQTLGTKVKLVRAQDAAAIAEVTLGPIDGRGRVLYVYGGRTLVTSCVHDGKICSDSFDPDALAHTPVSNSSLKCGCGAYGHLTTVASAHSISRALIGLASNIPQSLDRLLNCTKGRAESVTIKQVFALAKSGDDAASAIVRQAIASLAEGLSAVVQNCEFDLIVIGGALGQGGDALVGGLGQRLLEVNGVSPRIVVASRGPNAVLEGALALGHA